MTMRTIKVTRDLEVQPETLPKLNIDRCRTVSLTVHTSTAVGAMVATSTEPLRSSANDRLSMAAPLHRRRWLAWSLVVLAVLAVLRLAAPSLIASYLAARISVALGVSAQVDDVELRLWAGEITARGIQAAPPVDASTSSVELDALTLRWRWIDLMRGVVRIDGRVSGLDLTIDVHRPWPAEWDALSSRTSRLRSLTIEGGSVLLVHATDTPPLLALTDLRGRVNVTSGLKTETMTTQLSVTAQANEGGSFELVGAIAPAEPAAGWTLDFALERLDLRPLNPLLQQVFEMDVERGWLSLSGALTVGLGRLRGRLHPRFEELEVLGHDEHDVQHPMAEALLGSMLSGADLPIDIDRAASASGDSMFEATTRVDAMALLHDMILRGFVRRLDTLDDYEPAVGRAEIDFPGGRLSFFDITLTRSGGKVGRPFISIPRMDIVIEQSAVDGGVTTYKSIALHQPSLTFVTGENVSSSQIMFDPDWQAKVNVLPYPTDRVEIIDGRVEYRDDTTSPPTSLFISDLDLRADNLGRAKAHADRRGAKLVGRGRVMDLSALELEIEFTPGVVDLDAAMRLRLDPLPLRELDRLIEGRLGVDVSSGTLALVADLDAHDGRLQGTITPVLDEVRVLGVDEQQVIHPVRELMLERRLRTLDGATLTLDRHVRTSVLRELPAALMSAARRVR